MDALGIDWKKLLVGVGFLFVAEVLFLTMLPYLLFSALFGGGTAPAAPGGAALPAAVGLWVPLATAAAEAAHIPPALVLAVMAHESGGNWKAEDDDKNGTVDAGLMQINSANWAAFGLASNPFATAANVKAGVAILAGDLAANRGSVPAALEAYNAGSAIAGTIYDPQYAGDVARELTAIEAGPHLAATPLPVEGTTQAVLVTAYGPYGPVERAYGDKWRGLIPPRKLTATANNNTVIPLVPCATAAQSATGGVLPAAASCWVMRLAVGQQARVTATWGKTLQETEPGPKGPVLRTVQRATTVAVTVQ